jgi:hypothetical protein
MLVIADGRRDEIRDLWIDSAVDVQVLYVRETCPGSTLEAQEGTFPVSAKHQPEVYA